MKRLFNGFIAISAMMLPNLATANTIITPTSYSYTNGTPAGESLFTDPGNIKLTDGNTGSANPVDGTWVAWQTSDSGAAQITFNFGSSATITNVDLHFLRSDIANSELPEFVTVGSNTFAVTNFGTDNTPGFVDFAGSWTGNSLVVTLDHTTAHWVFINEAQFSTAGPAPEPASFTLAGVALGALILGRRRFPKLFQRV